MKIVIDYETEVPNEATQIMMENAKQKVLQKLEPIMPAFQSSAGVLLLHLDDTFELKEVPYKIAMEIYKLLEDDWSFLP